jgi:hypothetical protein
MDRFLEERLLTDLRFLEERFFMDRFLEERFFMDRFLEERFLTLIGLGEGPI